MILAIAVLFKMETTSLGNPIHAHRASALTLLHSTCGLTGMKLGVTKGGIAPSGTCLFCFLVLVGHATRMATFIE